MTFMYEYWNNDSDGAQHREDSVCAESKRDALEIINKKIPVGYDWKFLPDVRYRQPRDRFGYC